MADELKDANQNLNQDVNPDADDSERQMKIEIIKMGKFSFELEEKREQSLIIQSGYMLTGYSIISVILMAVIPILLNYTNLPFKLVFILLGFSLLFLIFSLLFALLSLWRYQYSGLDDIESVYKMMIHEPLDTVSDWWLKNINTIRNEKNSLNNKRARYVKWSTFFFGFSIITILIYLVATIFLLLLY